jgi:hypothetical protein
MNADSSGMPRVNLYCQIVLIPLKHTADCDIFVCVSLQSLKNSLHFIVDTAAGDHPFDPYLSLLKIGGVMAVVCFPSEIKLHPANLNLGNSLIICYSTDNYFNVAMRKEI